MVVREYVKNSPENMTIQIVFIHRLDARLFTSDERTRRLIKLE